MLGSSFGFFRFCDLGIVGFIDLLGESEPITVNRKLIVVNPILLLRNLLRRSPRFQHPECGQKPLNGEESTHCGIRSNFA
jgi:hypothetical protein